MTPLENLDLPAEILAAIKRQSGAAELRHVVTFKGRENKKGQDRRLTVEILHSPTGYTVKATDQDGRLATGNEYDDLASAIMGVHWDDLDKEPLP